MLPHRVDDVGMISSSMSSSHVCVPHTCITCKNICLGPIGDLSKYQFVFDEDTLDAYTKATNPDAREEGHAEAWTPSMLIHVFIYFCYEICYLKLFFIIE